MSSLAHLWPPGLDAEDDRDIDYPDSDGQPMAESDFQRAVPIAMKTRYFARDHLAAAEVMVWDE